MKKIAFVVAIGALCSMASACPSPNRTDAGVDTGISIGNDTGTGGGRDTGGRDAFRRPDAAVMVPAGACGAAINENGLFGPLPTSCLPRCAASTVTAIQACVSASTMMCMDTACTDCIDAALLADRTPSARAYLGDDSMGAPVLAEINCGGAPMGSMANIWDCETWQQYSCISDSCPMEFEAALICFQMNPMNGMTACASQLAALRSCQTTNMAELQSCSTTRARACYEGLGGFAPAGERSFLPVRDFATEASISEARSLLQR